MHAWYTHSSNPNVTCSPAFPPLFSMPKQHSFGQSADGSAIPCLWSEALQRNVYLIPGTRVAL